MKRCPRCGETKRLTDYSTSGTTRLASYCKPCMAAYNRGRYLADPERVRAQQRQWAREHPAANQAWRNRYVETNRSAMRVMWRCVAAVYRAVKNGSLIRPETCSDCGQAARQIQAAHLDYSRPLDVRWLCITCHRRFDIAHPKRHTAEAIG